MPEWTTLKRMIWLLLLRGASAVIRTVTGTAPLVLENAVAAAIKSLKQYGKCTQASTPTPDAPVDIMCNNGAIRWGAVGKNLINPDAAGAVNGSYINDGGVLSSDNTSFLSDYIPVVEGETYTAQGYKTFDGYANLRVHGFDASKTWTRMLAKELMQANEVTSTTFVIPSGVKYVRVCGYIGNRGGIDAMLELGSSASAYEPFVGGIYVDGTPEVLTVSGINLFDKSTMDTGQGYYVNANGVIVNGYNANRTVWIPCKPNTKYSYWHTGGAGGCRSFAMSKDTIAVNDEASWLKGSPAYCGKDVVNTITTPADAVKLYITAARSNLNPERTFDEQLDDFMVVEGEVAEATEYEPYVAPQTASVPMLLSVGDYKDEAEIVQGIKTGKVGIKVLNGTENIGTSNATYTIGISDRIASKVPVTCSHFPYSNKTSSQTDDGTIITFSSTNIGFRYDTCATKEAFKEWLAAQYAAGTPVIVIYPLAKETTEQTTAHALHTSAGTNVVDVESNVDPVELEVEYSASA